MLLLIKLLLAHLIGDFFLQTKSMVEAKETKKLAAPQLYLHVLIHVAFTALILWDENQWTILAAVFGSHLLIDTSKLYLQKASSQQEWFIFDQILHFVALYLISVFHTPDASLIPAFIQGNVFWIALTSLLFLTKPASLITKVLISRWTPESSGDDNSLERAGNIIGILERLFVFGFVVAGQWQAVGFLLAAKSIFRFGDLRAGTERKLTEYVLIGTLLSFGMACATGILYKALA